MLHHYLYHMTNSMHGFYQVGQEKFNSKILALMEATRKKENVSWNFHEDVWSKYDMSVATNLDLEKLYLQRAQQLRSTYDYLILSYSGGSDSWYILNTFIENNIHLDEVYIRWPIKAIESNRVVYTPNKDDYSAHNALSEWDFVIKQDLEMIRQKIPNTKITIYDWTDDVNSEITESEFFITNHFISLWNIKRFVTQGFLEKKMLDIGKKVGVMFGIDKPIIYQENNKCYMRFIDHLVALAFSDGWRESKVEYFYWSPDMPEIAITQAQCVYRWMKTQHKNLTNILKINNKFLNYRFYNDIAKMICFPKYDLTKFQVDKPTSILYSEKESWACKLPEYSRALDAWKWHVDQYFKLIDNRYLDIRDGVVHSLKPINSKSYYLGRLDE